jgi:ATP-dependent Clp protease ATP-binding subunit ClpC
MFERFTDRARYAVVTAQEEARRLSHNYIGTEHLLLGLLRTQQGLAARALTAMDVALDDVRAEVESLIGEGQETPAAHIPFTPRAKKVLELSLREAVRLRHHYIGTEHLLLGLIREGEGVGAQVLRARGLDLAAITTKVHEMMEGVATGTEGRGGPRIGRVEDFLAPTCSKCHGAIEETGAYRDLEIPEDGGDGQTKMRFVFCGACGHTIMSFPVTE